MRNDARCPGWLVVGVVLSMISPVLAQSGPALDDAIMRLDGRWNSEQRRQAERYIQAYARQLNAADVPQTLADARQSLIAKLQTPGATTTAKDQYSAIAATAIEPAVGRDNSPLARLNAMIVAGSLFGGHAINLVVDAMDDPSVAVQYWAFKAAAQMAGQQIGEQRILSEKPRRQLLDAATDALAADRVRTTDVRDKAYDVLAQLDLPEAHEQLIMAMDARLAHYVNTGLDDSLRAERTGFRRLYRSLLEAQIQQRADEQQIRQLLQLATRYLRLIGAKAADGIPTDAQPVCVELVDQLERTLNWAAKVFDEGLSSDTTPKLRDPFVAGRGNQYAEFRLNAEAWVNLVRRVANFAPGDLALPRADQAGAGDQAGVARDAGS